MPVARCLLFTMTLSTPPFPGAARLLRPTVHIPIQYGYLPSGDDGERYRGERGRTVPALLVEREPQRVGLEGRVVLLRLRGGEGTVLHDEDRSIVIADIRAPFCAGVVVGCARRS